MSKIKETLAKICSTIAIVPIASLAFIACTTNKDNGKNNNDSADNTSNISNPRPTPDPTPGDDINDENKEIHANFSHWACNVSGSRNSYRSG